MRARRGATCLGLRLEDIRRGNGCRNSGRSGPVAATAVTGGLETQLASPPPIQTNARGHARDWATCLGRGDVGLGGGGRHGRRSGITVAAAAAAVSCADWRGLVTKGSQTPFRPDWRLGDARGIRPLASVSRTLDSAGGAAAAEGLDVAGALAAAGGVSVAGADARGLAGADGLCSGSAAIARGKRAFGWGQEDAGLNSANGSGGGRETGHRK